MADLDELSKLTQKISGEISNLPGAKAKKAILKLQEEREKIIAKLRASLR